MTKLSKEDKDQVRLLNNNGMGYGKISKLFKVSKSAIRRIIKTKGYKQKVGPKHKLDKNDKRRIKSFIQYENQHGRKLTSNKIMNEFDLKVHRTTISRALKVMRFNYCNVPHKFKLSLKMKQKRIDVCKKFLIGNTNWSKVIYSDEKSFHLYGCDSYYSWMQGNSSNSNVKRVLKSPSVMVWAMITSNGLCSFKFMKGKQNSDKYISIIKDIVIPIGYLNIGKDFIYQQDNCPIHVSRKTKAFMNTSGIQLLEWPPYSPDINIIENLWALISHIVYKEGYPKNLTELKSRISIAFQEVNETKRNAILNMYGTIRTRLCEVILRRGERINY